MSTATPAASPPAPHFMNPYGNLVANDAGAPLVITRGDGIHVFDVQGRKYLEGVSALWYAALGFSEQRLADAAYRQMTRLPCYHAFGNKAVDVCIELADRLVAVAPPGLKHVFFASSGSEANDTALKFVRYYNNALGRPKRKKVIARAWGYHGTTLATASMTGVPRNHVGFDLPMPGILHTACPDPYHGKHEGETDEGFADRLVAQLAIEIAQEGPETVAAFIAEPVMGVGGVIVPPRTYFAKVQALLKRHGILFLVDEVITGFGRLGKMFGSEVFDLQPDMLVVAKAFSGGYLPISALLIRDEIYREIARFSAENGVLGHGFTYTAHPVPAAVALETMNIFAERDIVGHVQRVQGAFWQALAPVRDSPIVGELRGLGLIAGIELVADRTSKRPFAAEAGATRVLESHCLAEGLILRAIGNTMVAAPPLIITEAGIDELAGKLLRALRKTEDQLLAGARSTHAMPG